MKRILAVMAAVTALFVVAIPAAHAADIEIPVSTVIRADEGSITLLATTDVDPELVGESCAIHAEARNQSSVHPGNDLIVASDGASVVLADVERAPDAITKADQPLVLGPEVTVSLRMGQDGVFSGGVTVSIDGCAPPTTTTTTPTAPPVIQIVKTADPVEYGDDGIGHFTIEVTNPGPVDLTDVYVTDDVALAMDPGSDCPQPALPDLAVGDSYSYACSVANLDGVSPFTNEATAIGTGPDGRKAVDTDDATVFPPVVSTTITQPPTTVPPTTQPPTTVPPTLPNTGVPYEQVRGFSYAGFAFVLAGLALLSAAAVLGRHRIQAGYREIVLRLEPLTDVRTIYISLRRDEAD